MRGMWGNDRHSLAEKVSGRGVVTTPLARATLQADDVTERGGGHYGFLTRRFTGSLRAGENEVVVRFTNFFNVTFNWAGLVLRVLDWLRS